MSWLADLIVILWALDRASSKLWAFIRELRDIAREETA